MITLAEKVRRLIKLGGGLNISDEGDVSRRTAEYFQAIEKILSTSKRSPTVRYEGVVGQWDDIFFYSAFVHLQNSVGMPVGLGMMAFPTGQGGTVEGAIEELWKSLTEPGALYVQTNDMKHIENGRHFIWNAEKGDWQDVQPMCWNALLVSGFFDEINCRKFRNG